MSYLITKDKVQPLYLWPLCMLLCLTLYIPTITAQAATFLEVPQDSSTYTPKKENYNPEYEYCLYKTYSSLPSLGHEAALVTVPGFIGTEDKARAFSKYHQPRLSLKKYGRQIPIPHTSSFEMFSPWLRPHLTAI